jgi:ArsR family transcriptional regulator
MSNCKKNSCTPKNLKLLADNLQIIAEPNRLKILCLLSSGTKCVCEIEGELKLKQNLISHHLKVLRESGLVKAEKEGLWKRYSLKNKPVKSLIKNLTEILNV